MGTARLGRPPLAAFIPFQPSRNWAPAFAGEQRGYGFPLAFDFGQAERGLDGSEAGGALFPASRSNQRASQV